MLKWSIRKWILRNWHLYITSFITKSWCLSLKVVLAALSKAAGSEEVIRPYNCCDPNIRINSACENILSRNGVVSLMIHSDLFCSNERISTLYCTPETEFKVYKLVISCHIEGKILKRSLKSQRIQLHNSCHVTANLSSFCSFFFITRISSNKWTKQKQSTIQANKL